MTKQDALMLILEDQHEHLGQSIAVWPGSHRIGHRLTVSK
jgi:hypothetical protein